MDIIITTFSSLFLGTILLLRAIPWWPVIKIAITLSFIIIPLMLLLRHLRNHPLSEGSAAYLWSGLWILSYTRLTMRIYKYLQSNGIVRYRLSRLPTEIWYQILTFALDMPEIMDSICTFEIIWEYIYYHRFQQFIRSGNRIRMHTKPPAAPPYQYSEEPNHPLEVHMRQRLVLSLVCSEWNSILRRCPTEWSFGLPDDSHTARRLELILGDTHTQQNDGVFLMNWAKDLDPARLHTLAICDLTSPTSEIVPCLLGLAEQRPDIAANLLCISYTGAHINRFGSVWGFFVNLTTLIVETELVEMDMELPKLRVLMLKSARLDLQRWRCPSLQHCVLIDLHKIDEPLNIDMQFIPFPSSLLSLIVYNRSLIVDEVFWQSYSSLAHIGFSSLDYQYPPPQGHPLCSISIVDPTLSESTLSGFLSFINSGHSIRSIWLIPRYSSTYSSHPLNERWNKLYWETQRRGIVAHWIPVEVLEQSCDLSNQVWNCSRSIPRRPWPGEPRWIDTWGRNLMARLADKRGLTGAGFPTAMYLGTIIGALHGLQIVTMDKGRWLVALDFIIYELVGMTLLALFMIVHPIYLELIT